MTDKTSKVSIDDTFKAILKTDLTRASISVCLASTIGENEQPVYQRLQITDDLTAEFRQVVQDVLSRYGGDFEQGEAVLRKYDPGAKLDGHEIAHIDLSEKGFVLDQIEGLGELSSMERFAAEVEFISHLRFYVIIVEKKKGDYIYFFRSYSEKRELGRSKLFAALMSRGQYDSVKQSVFLFDRNLDCVSRGDDLFIFSQDKFQKIFQFFEMVKRSAEKVLKKVKEAVPIDNFDAFADSCRGHLQKLAKLNNIAAKPYFSKLTIDDIKKVTTKHEDLQSIIVKKDGKEMLSFDAKDKWAILRVLDDDYLDSIMTGQSYEVNSKRQLK